MNLSTIVRRAAYAAVVATGLTVLAFAYSTTPVNASHMNPAYTVGYLDGFASVPVAYKNGYNAGRSVGFDAGLAKGLKTVRAVSYIAVTSCGSPKLYIIALSNGHVLMIDPDYPDEREYLAGIEKYLPPLVEVPEDSDCA